MKLALLTAVAVPAVLAHGINARDHLNIARQAATLAAGAASAATSSAPSAASAASHPASSGSSAPAGSGSIAAASGTPPPVPLSTVPFSLASTNPTAAPITNIISGASSQPTIPLSTTFPAGAQPTFLPNAPGLPNLASVNPANYPTLDKPPPTDSPEVQQWIQDVKNSGIQIPNIAPTVAGGCAANAQAAADSSRCWWTCGGCTRDSDVTTCPDKMTWGLTYDDGPAFYTPNLLQYLDQQNLKSTFFVVGSRAISYPALLQDEYMAQHQIAVHTWSHPAMTTLTNEEAIAELGWTKKVIKDVLGVTPNYWRPPYGDIDDRIRAISKAMDLTPIMWTRISPVATFDTGDFDVAGGLTSASQVLSNWAHIIGNATTLSTGFIVLEHDLFQQSVDIATGYILPDALAHQPKFTIEPVVSCLHKPLADAYIETNDNTTNPPVVNGSGVVTFSSGAPGSAQQTGVSGGNKQSGSAALVLNTGSIGLLVAAIAALAGFTVVQ